MPPELWVIVTFFLASVVHTTAGFGAALVAMALLVPILRLMVTAPLVAMIVLTLQLLIVYRYINKLSLHTIRYLLIAIMIGTPIGIWGVSWLDEALVLGLLGVMILAYVAYNIFGQKAFVLNERPRWAFLFGTLAGIVSGAYNSGGPLIVMYFQARGNAPDEFRVNVQTTFIVGTIFVILGHAFKGAIDSTIFIYYFYAIPAMLLGFWVGTHLARHIQPHIFRWVVLGLLTILALQLIL